MGESNNTNIARETIISQWLYFSSKGLGAHVPVLFLSFVSARCIGYFPKNFEQNMREAKTKLAALKCGHELGRNVDHKFLPSSLLDQLLVFF